MLEVSTNDVLLFAEHMKAEADERPEGESAPMTLPAKTELSSAEYEALVSSMKANAEIYGRRRN